MLLSYKRAVIKRTAAGNTWRVACINNDKKKDHRWRMYSATLAKAAKIRKTALDRRKTWRQKIIGSGNKSSGQAYEERGKRFRQLK